jgi:chemotaxis protein MotB
LSAAKQPIIIKKKTAVHGGGHHGGSWKVAYADFVTAMMAFFMVMWIMGLSEETRKSIQGYFNDPIGFNKGEPRSKSVISLSTATSGKPSNTTKGGKAYDLEQRALERIEQKVKQEIAREQGLDDVGKDVKVTITPEGMMIELVETRGAVFFESGSAIVRPEARKIIAHLAPILARSGHALVIQGHTDAAPFAGPSGNFGLSASRAMSLMQELRAGGCPESQFNEVVGYGSTRLENPGKPLDFSNRRVTILIPRSTSDGTAKPSEELKERLAGGGQPQAIDLRPEPVTIHAQAEAHQETPPPKRR